MIKKLIHRPLINKFIFLVMVLCVAEYAIAQISSATPQTHSNAQFRSGLSTPNAFQFDGNSVYIFDLTTDKIYEYGSASLGFPGGYSTTPKDELDVSVQETSPTCFRFNDDGSRLYVIGTSGDKIVEYLLSTDHDISTASYRSNGDFSVQAQTGSPQSFRFADSGTKMFVGSGNTIYQYNLSIPYYPGNATYAGSSKNFQPTDGTGATATFLRGFEFNQSGYRFFALDEGSDKILEFQLTTPYDLSTATYADEYVNGTQGGMTDIHIYGSNYSSFMILGTSGDDIDVFSMNSYPTVSSVTVRNSNENSTDVQFLASFRENVFGVTLDDFTITPTQDVAYENVNFEYSTDRNYYLNFENVTGTGTIDVTLKDSGTDIFDTSSDQLPLSGGWKKVSAFVGTRYNLGAFKYRGDGQALPFASNSDFDAVAFNNDGTKMFLANHGTDSIRAYSLATPYDVSTASKMGASEGLNISNEEGNVTDLAWNNSGTQLFITGTNEDNIIAYTLSTPYDLKTAIFSNAVSVNAQTTAPYGFAFSQSGDKLFIIGNTDEILEYSLSTPFDISTFNYAGDAEAFPVSSYDSNIRTIAFDDGGDRMFIAGTQNDVIYLFNLATAYDVSTATYAGDDLSLDVGDLANASTPYDIEFGANGTQLFIVDLNADQLFEFGSNDAPGVSSFEVVGAPGITVVDDEENHEVTFAISFNEPVQNVSIADFDLSRPLKAFTAVSASSFTETEDGYEISYTVEAKGSGALVLTPYESSDIQDYDGQGLSSFPSSDPYLYGSNYNLSHAEYQDEFLLRDNEAQPLDFEFNADGSKLFVLGRSDDQIDQYSLSVNYDVTTAQFDGDVEGFDVSAQTTNPTDMAFNDTGLKMFVLSTSTIFEYDLSAAFDVSTAVYAGDAEQLQVSSEESGAYAMAFNDIGTRLFVSGTGGGNIVEYVISWTDPYDISTAYYAGEEKEFDPGSIKPMAMCFNEDGSLLYATASNYGGDIYAYLLKTDYLVSSAIPLGKVFDVGSQEGQVYSIGFNGDGSSFYVVGLSGDDITQYNIEKEVQIVDFFITNVSSSGVVDLKLVFDGLVEGVGPEDFVLETSGGLTAEVQDAIPLLNRNEYFIRVTNIYGDGVLTVSLSESGTGITSLDGFAVNTAGIKSLTIPFGSSFDVSQAEYLGVDESFYVGGQEVTPYDMAFNNDGTKLFVMGISGDDINEYALSTPYDISTASFTAVFDTGVEQNSPYAFKFDDTGKELYILASSDDIKRFNLSTAFDVSTITYGGASQTLDVSSQETSAYSFSFNADGTKLFVMGASGDDVNEYNLTQAYDITTASFLGQSEIFSVKNEDSSPYSMTFSSDGYTMVVLGGSGNDLNEYKLTTAFDVSTAVYSGDEERYDFSGEFVSARAVAFNNDGLKMYILEQSNDRIHEYDLNAAPKVHSINTAYGTNKTDALVDFNVRFSEAVTGVSTDDFSLIGISGTFDGEILSIEGDGYYYTVNTRINSGQGTLELRFEGAESGVVDLLSKPIGDQLFAGTHDFDIAIPTATITIDDTALKIGDTPTLTITFSEEVEGFETTDLIPVNGTVSALSTTDDIIFTATYTPDADIEDSENIITIDMSELTDVAGNAGNVDVSTENFEIDTKRPTVTYTVYNINSESDMEMGVFDLVFNEPVSGLQLSNISMTNGTFSEMITNDGGQSYSVYFTVPTKAEIATNSLSIDLALISDDAGNFGSGVAVSENFVIDTKFPTVSVEMADDVLSIGESTTVTYTFSEPVNISSLDLINFTTPNLTASNLNFTNGSSVLTFDVSPISEMQDYTNAITSYIEFRDLIGNTSIMDPEHSPSDLTSENYVVDVVRPTVAVVLDDLSLITGESAEVTFTFTEAVSDFDNTDITIENGTLSDVETADEGLTFTATFTPTVGIEVETNMISVNNAGYVDAVGNAGEGSSESPNFEINTVVPTLAISIDDTNLILDETATITFTFSEAVTGFDNDDITVPNGTLSAVSSADDGVTFTAIYTPTPLIEELENVISVDNAGFEDLSGNAGVGISETENFVIDGVIPTVIVSMSDDGLIAGETSLVTFTFSEQVVGFDNDDVTAPMGTLTDVVSEDEGLTYTATFTPNADVEPAGDFFITTENVGVADLRGNAGSETSSGPSYDIETLRPTLIITLDDDLLAVGETMGVTFTFSESVYGFDNEDITFTDGVLTDVSTENDVVFTAVFTPTNDLEADEIVITTRDGAVKDDSGNLIIDTVSSPDFEIDTKNPTLTISLDDLKLLEAEDATITFEFSEEVMDFTEEDVIVENGQVGMLATLDNMSFTAVFTPDVEVADVDNVISVDGNSYTDLAGNAGGESSESESFEINTVIPVITFDALVSKTYGDDPFDLIASASSGLTVTFESSNPEVAIIEGTLVTILSAGSTTITATQPGDEDKNASIAVEQTLTVNKALLTIAVDDQTKIYGQSNPELTFAYFGFVLEEDESVIDTAPSVTTLADELSPVAEYELTASGGADGNYAFEYVAGTLTITKATLMATADDQSKSYGADNPALTIAYSGFVNGDDASDITEPEISTSATVASGVGTYPITLSDGSAVNYIIENTDAILTVSVADLVVSADNQTRAYGEENPALTITYDGFVLDETSDDLDIAPAIDTEANSTSDVGEYAITVSGAQDANYSITFEQGILTIEKADQTIDFATVQEIDLLNENTIELTASASSEMEVVFSLISGDGSILGNVFTANASGTYTVEASQAGDENYNASSVSQTFNVTDSRKDNQAISFSELSDKVYGDLPFNLTATANSGLAVTYTATGPVSLEGDEVTIIGAGDVTITASQNGDDTFNPAPSVSQSFAVAKAILTATAGDQTTTFGETIPELTISYAGFVGSDNSSNLDVLPTSGTTATVGSDAGDYEITVSGGSDDNYEMDYVSGLLTIEKADQTIEFATVEEIDLLNENTVTLLATASTGLDVVFSLVSGDGSLDGNILTASASGTFVIEVSQAGNGNYNAVSISQSFNVNDSRKDDQIITFAELADKTYGDDPFNISAVASSDLGVTFSAVGPVSMAGTEITILGAGEVIITAAQAGDDTYNPAPSVAQSFVVAKASLTATADDKTTTYGIEIPDLTVDYSGFVGADAIADLDELPTAATTATMGSDAGTYEIKVSGGSDDNYELAFISGLLTIEKADQTVTFSAIEDIDIATQTTVSLSATASSELAIDFNLVSGDGSIEGAVLTVNNTGTFVVEASQAGSTNYNAASAIQTFNVNDSGKTDQSISFGELTDKVYGDAPFDISATATSSLGVSFTAAGPVSILDNEVTITGAGEVTITATQTGDDAFNPAPSVSQSFIIEKATLTVTAEDKSIHYGMEIPDLTIVYTGFVGTDDSADLDVLPTAATLAVLGSDVGDYEITVSGGNDDNYEMTYISGSLAIARADQAITFAAIDDIDIANVSIITLNATSTSELDVVYTLVQGDGSIAGNVLTVASTGTYIVEASQAGNDNYNAALSVSQIFNVTDSQKADQTITFESLDDKVYGDVFTLGASASSGLSVSYSVASGPATLTDGEVNITGVGSITIVATQAGDDTFNPAAAVSQTFAVAKAPLMATADDQAITYGDDIPVLTITYQGFVAGESASDLDEEPFTTTTATPASDAGEYAITTAGGASVNYEITLADGTFIINKATATITISDLEFDVDGTPKMPTITTDPVGLNFTVSYAGAATAPSEAGNYEVIVTIDETNYVGSETATLVLNEVLATVQSLGIRTYPNPTTQYFRVDAAMNLQFEVYSMSGVLELMSETNKQTDVSLLSEGVYLIRVLDARGKVVATKQLIKQ